MTGSKIVISPSMSIPYPYVVSMALVVSGLLCSYFFNVCHPYQNVSPGGQESGLSGSHSTEWCLLYSRFRINVTNEQWIR